mmetsp:Transcript_22562/g.63208  ORF Transcript_22562/g.63208 Transcript_22562/m.63208 type:complete len:204 (+) Transcript_22562:606-1217(+)
MEGAAGSLARRPGSPTIGSAASGSPADQERPVQTGIRLVQVAAVVDGAHYKVQLVELHCAPGLLHVLRVLLLREPERGRGVHQRQRRREPAGDPAEHAVPGGGEAAEGEGDARVAQPLLWLEGLLHFLGRRLHRRRGVPRLRRLPARTAGTGDPLGLVGWARADVVAPPALGPPRRRNCCELQRRSEVLVPVSEIGGAGTGVG